MSWKVVIQIPTDAAFYPWKMESSLNDTGWFGKGQKSHNNTSVMHKFRAPDGRGDWILYGRAWTCFRRRGFWGWSYIFGKHVHSWPSVYLLTPWCRVLLEKLIGLQLVKKCPVFHGTRRFITALTSIRHLSLSWASPIQSIYPHPTSWRSILIFTHLPLGLPSGLLPSGFPTKTLYNPLSSPIHATCPAHLILLDFITRTILGEEYKSFSSSLCNLLVSTCLQIPSVDDGLSPATK